MGSGASSLAEKYSDNNKKVGELDNLDRQLRIYQHKVTKEVAFVMQEEAAFLSSDSAFNDYQELCISSSGREYLRDLKITVNNPSERRSVNSTGSDEPELKLRSIGTTLVDFDKDGKRYCIVCKNEFEVTQSQWDRHHKACSSRSALKSIFEDLDKQVNLAFLALSLNAPLNSLVKSYVAGIISSKYYCNINQIYFLRNEIRGYLQGLIADSRAKDGSPLVLTSESGLGNKLIIALEVLKKKEDYILQHEKYLPKIGDYDIYRCVGKGSFAEVYLGRSHETNQYFALKVFSKKRFKTVGQIDLIVKERKTMCLLNRYRDQFVHLCNAFQSSTDLFLVMEYLQGGDCLSLLTKLRTLPENLARHIIAQVAVALDHLHSHGLVHRDVKPDNIYLTAKGHAKLGDFGTTIPIQKERDTLQASGEFQTKTYREAPDLLSEAGSGGNSSSTSSISLQYSSVRPISDIVGNYFYASPEIVNGTGLYDPSVDWWALGVMLFHFLAGITPFEGEQKSITLANIENMECNWRDLPVDAVSADCQRFLRSILSERLETRLGTASSQDILEHAFFRALDFSHLYTCRSPYLDLFDSSSLGGLEESTWLEERRYPVPAFDQEEPIKSNLTDEEKSHLVHDPYSDFNFIE